MSSQTISTSPNIPTSWYDDYSVLYPTTSSIPCSTAKIGAKKKMETKTKETLLVTLTNGTQFAVSSLHLTMEKGELVAVTDPLLLFTDLENIFSIHKRGGNGWNIRLYSGVPIHRKKEREYRGEDIFRCPPWGARVNQKKKETTWYFGPRGCY